MENAATCVARTTAARRNRPCTGIVRVRGPRRAPRAAAIPAATGWSISPRPSRAVCAGGIQARTERRQGSAQATETGTPAAANARALGVGPIGAATGPRRARRSRSRTSALTRSIAFPSARTRGRSAAGGRATEPSTPPARVRRCTRASARRVRGSRTTASAEQAEGQAMLTGMPRLAASRALRGAGPTRAGAASGRAATALRRRSASRRPPPQLRTRR